MNFEQVGIICTGLVALVLLQFGGPRCRAVAPFVGLAGQPFWMIAAVQAHQVGIFVVTMAYTAVWTMGCVKVLTRGVKP